jgi:hypothetical protein
MPRNLPTYPCNIAQRKREPTPQEVHDALHSISDWEKIEMKVYGCPPPHPNFEKEFKAPVEEIQRKVIRDFGLL